MHSVLFIPLPPSVIRSTLLCFSLVLLIVTIFLRCLLWGLRCCSTYCSRLKAKEAELRAKEIEMQGLLEQQDEAKQLILVLQQQQQGGKKDEGERDTVNQQPQGQEGQTGLVESPTPGIESTSSASSTAAPVVLKKRLSPRSQLLAMARPPLAPPPKPPVGYDQPNGVPEKKDMTMRIPLPNATLLGSTPPSKTISVNPSELPIVVSSVDQAISLSSMDHDHKVGEGQLAADDMADRCNNNPVMKKSVFFSFFWIIRTTKCTGPVF